MCCARWFFRAPISPWSGCSVSRWAPVVRYTAAAVGALVGLLYVLPAALSGLTGVTVAKYFPTMIAGNSLAVSKPVADVLSP